MKTSLETLLPIVLASATAFGQGTILWDESVNGPLSTDGDSPTSLSPSQEGTNSVIGSPHLTPDGAGWRRADDIFTFTVPARMQVTALGVTVDTSAAVWFGDPSFLTEYGYAITSSTGDLLALWGLTQISSGAYGAYVSDNDFQSFPTAANYRLDFVVQAVPEPSALSLLLAGAGCVVAWRWRKKLPCTSR